MAAAIGVGERAIRATGLPIQQVSCGVPFVIVPVDTRASVDAAVPDVKALATLAQASGHDHFSVYPFTMDRGNDAAMVYSRMFAPGLGVYEDPANLQGVKLGRPSWIHIAIDSADRNISRVRVGGTSVFVAEGAMDVED